MHRAFSHTQVFRLCDPKQIRNEISSNQTFLVKLIHFMNVGCLFGGVKFQIYIFGIFFFIFVFLIIAMMVLLTDSAGSGFCKCCVTFKSRSIFLGKPSYCNLKREVFSECGRHSANRHLNFSISKTRREKTADTEAQPKKNNLYVRKVLKKRFGMRRSLYFFSLS